MPDCKITFKVPGGLGNQLFSLYCAIYAATKISSPVALDLSSVDKSHYSADISLLSVGLPSNLIKVNTSTNVNYEPITMLNTWKQNIRRRLGIHRSHVFEPGYDSISAVSSFLDQNRERIRRGITIEGYFGDFGFYDAVEPPFKDLKLRNESSAYMEMLSKLDEFYYFAVHHRLGDFLQLSNSVGLLGKNYFNESFKQARKSGCERFLIFSNDPGMSKKIFEEWGFDLNQMTWVDSNFLTSPFENLLLMGQTRGLITSNSTFSFWGGRLAKEQCKTIFYPKVYRKDNFTEVLNIPANWIPIDSNWQQN